MQNQQELYISIFGESALYQQVFPNIFKKNEPYKLNIDGWNISVITSGMNKPSDNPLAYLYFFSSDEIPMDLLLRSEESRIKTFIITKEDLSNDQIVQAQSEGVSCFTLDNYEQLLTALHDCLTEKFLEETVIPELATPIKDSTFVHSFCADLLKYAANIAIEKWANNSLRNLKSEARERLASFDYATDDNCHALLTQVLLGKGDYGIGSLKFFLMQALGMTAAKNSEESKRNILRAINHLENCLYYELQHIKVHIMNKNQKVVCFLDKKQITKENVCKAYETYLQSKPKVMITDENYRLQFKKLIKDESPFAVYMIASLFKMTRSNAKEIRKTLHDELVIQNIADPSCDLRVLSSDYWKAVCDELNKVCPENLQESWAKVKSDMATVFNDADALWLYYPQDRVLGVLKNICENLCANSEIYPAKTMYLLDVLEDKSIDLDRSSCEILAKNSHSLKTLRDKSFMNRFSYLRKKLAGSSSFDRFADCSFLHFKNLAYDQLFSNDNHELMRLFLIYRQPENVWIQWCSEAIQNNHIKIVQVLLADKKIDSNYHMRDAYMAGSIEIVRLLCPIQQSWSKVITGLMPLELEVEASHISMMFMMLTARNFLRPLFFEDKEFLEVAARCQYPTMFSYTKHLTNLVNRAPSFMPSLLHKYTLFSSISAFPRKVTNRIMEDMVNAHSSQDMTDEEIRSLVESPPVTKT